jgi:predicted metal-binding protein
VKTDYETSAGDGFARGTNATAAEPCVTVVVCSSCRDETGSDARPRAGEQLAEDTKRAAAGSSVRVETVECLGNCKRRLSAAIVKRDAWSYVFGDLSVASGADLVAGAMLFAGTEDAILPWRGRPQSLKQGLVARIPPIFPHKDFSA